MQVKAPDSDIFVLFGDSTVDAAGYSGNTTTSSDYETTKGTHNIGVAFGATHVSFIAATGGTTDVRVTWGQGSVS
jgi:hypothetical protein